jgi:hypothetical protein
MLLNWVSGTGPAGRAALPSKPTWTIRPSPSALIAAALGCPATGDWISSPERMPTPCAAPELLMSKKSPLTAATARDRSTAARSGSSLVTAPELT